MKTVVIVGGGIVGLATARAMRARYPLVKLILLEKEGGTGRHQSTHNSGVLHCGLAYKPGSLKARLAVEGIELMTAFCRQHAIPHEICGKVVVATREEELPRLQELLRRGHANGLRGLRELDGAGLRELEPHAAGLAGAQVPQEGIVDYGAVCERLTRDLLEADVEVRTGWAVNGFERRGRAWLVQTPLGEVEADYLINCAGLHCDRVSAWAGELRRTRIVPFRGEYYQLSAGARGLVRHLIYPVPDPAFPFLGVHFTRLIRGGVEAGPNAVLAFAREGYRFRDVNGLDLWDALSFGGLWRFMRKYPRMVTDELKLSLSRRHFCRALQRLVPEIRECDLEAGGSGVRAQAVTPEGDLVQDFELIQRDNALHVLNAASPAATASLAIGRYLAGLVVI
jgi:L-2-hydroxyglutarate oxidase